MSDSPNEQKAAHLRSVIITTCTALLGIGAAVAATAVSGDATGAEAAGDTTALLLLVVAMAVQIPLYRLLGYDDFGGAKDTLYLVFMTFSFWFIAYGIVLTTEVSL